MKILFTVEFYEPHKGGAEEVVKQLAECLVKFGHQVSVATSFISERKGKELNGVKVQSFRISGNLVRGIKGSEGEIKKYQKLLTDDWDVVINYAAQIWTTDLIFEVLDKVKAKKILVPCGYSGLGRPEYKEYFEQLPAYLGRYDSLVYMSPNYQDKVFGDAHGLGVKAILIPNGASGEEFSAKDKFKIKEKLGIRTKYLAITVANHYLAKGHGFVIKAFKKLKRKDISLLIIGEVPGKSGIFKLAHLLRGCYKNCFVSGWFDKSIKIVSGKNRQLVLSAYKNADLFLFGSEIECAPLVMYESFAARVLFITRDVGNVRDHENLLKIVKTPEEMAETANFYLDHPDERNNIIDLAFAEWQNKYDWGIIVKQYENLFQKLVRSNVER